MRYVVHWNFSEFIERLRIPFSEHVCNLILPFVIAFITLCDYSLFKSATLRHFIFIIAFSHCIGNYLAHLRLFIETSFSSS